MIIIFFSNFREKQNNYLFWGAKRLLFTLDLPLQIDMTQFVRKIQRIIKIKVGHIYCTPSCYGTGDFISLILNHLMSLHCLHIPTKCGNWPSPRYYMVRRPLAFVTIIPQPPMSIFHILWQCFEQMDCWNLIKFKS
jgi:hypothetical protein